MDHPRIRLIILLLSLLHYASDTLQAVTDDVVNHPSSPSPPLFPNQTNQHHDNSETLKIKMIDTGNPDMHIVVVS